MGRDKHTREEIEAALDDQIRLLDKAGEDTSNLKDMRDRMNEEDG